MRFLTRNLDACVTHKMILPRCGNIEFATCKYNFKIEKFQIFGVSNVPNLRTSKSLDSEIFDPRTFRLINLRTFERSKHRNFQHRNDRTFEFSNLPSLKPSRHLNFQTTNLSNLLTKAYREPYLFFPPSSLSQNPRKLFQF